MRILSSLLAAALVIASPGLGAYEAAAQIVRISVEAPVAVPGSAGVAGTAGRAPGLESNLSVSALGTVALPTVVRPEVAESEVSESLEAAPAEIAPTEAAAEAAEALAAPAAPQSRASRVRASFKALRNFFGSRRAEEIVGGSASEKSRALAPSLAPAEASAAEEPPLPPSAPGKGAPSPWRNANIFIGVLLLCGLGVEAWSAVWNKWVQTGYGMQGFTIVTMIEMAAGLVAGYAGGWAADKVGLKKTFLGAGVLLAAAAAAILWFGTGPTMLPFLGLAALAGVRNFMYTASGTAQNTIAIAIFKGDGKALQKFNAVSQTSLEILGFAVPFFIGTLVLSLGSVGTMWILPGAMVAALVISALFMKVPEHVSQLKAKAAAEEHKVDPALVKIGMWAYPAFIVLNYLLYKVWSTGLANILNPGSGREIEDAVNIFAGKLTGLYSLGGLFAGAWLSGYPQAGWNWLKSKWPWLKAFSDRFVAKFNFTTSALGQEPDAAKELRSTAKWLIVAAVGLACFIPFLFGSPVLAAAAMLPFGFTNVMATILLLTMVQANAPEGKKGKTMGALRTISILAATVAVFGFGKLFELFPGSLVPIWAEMGFLAALAAYYVWMAVKLFRHAKK